MIRQYQSGRGFINYMAVATPPAVTSLSSNRFQPPLCRNRIRIRIPAETTVVLQMCPDFQEVRQVHAQLVVSGLLHRPPNGARPMETYMTVSHVYPALSILNAMPCPDVFAFNTIIRDLTKHHHPYQALLVYKRLLLDGLTPDSYTYTFILKACSQLKAQGLFEGKQVHCRILKIGISPADTYISTSLINMYTNSAAMSCAERVLAQLSVEEVTAGTNTLTLVARSSNNNAIISGYLRQGNVVRARTMFNKMVAKDVASWSAMITGYTQNGLYTEALTIFQEMMMVNSHQVCPNESALVSSLSACAHLGALLHGRLIHAYINKTSGAEFSVNLGTALIHMYAKCGSIQCSYKAFQKMAHRDIVTWGAIISAFAMHGQAHKCFQLFDEMVSQGIQPNEIIFVAILSACTHAGHVELGHFYFNQMVRDFGITPSIEHYGCMVDLLGRAGRLAEAQDFISAMPEKPNSIIWGALLSACRTHNDLERGKLAFSHLTMLEPMSGDRYKLAGLMFCNAGEKENATKIRRFLKENDLETTPGLSFIEIDCVVSEFVSGKVDHKKASEIHRMLKTINRHLYIREPEFD
ncbi:hypothetical protein FNV43_RR03677 [Rhamnella rubrinervis]|uniref:Pentatricopeptide repeat-containing protein n=1 Tax=Rhamnella rubrinervis TaxID=2594499 RepID=A0A8K0HIE2_9ROSA|nr:hypothetical protein FNV43_RR03677 [Rhamnella rubrinervis]